MIRRAARSLDAVDRAARVAAGRLTGEVDTVVGAPASRSRMTGRWPRQASSKRLRGLGDR